MGCGLREVGQAAGGEAPDALHVAETGLGQVLKIPNFAVSISVSVVLSQQVFEKPTSTCRQAHRLGILQVRIRAARSTPSVEVYGSRPRMIGERRR